MSELYQPYIIRRFVSRIDRAVPDGCWPWTGSLYGSGYGRFYAGPGKRDRYAHRVSYELHIGPIPDGLLVRHKCRLRRCVAPHHLELGTQAENMGSDTLRDGTRAWGARNGHAKLTDDDVRTIRRLRAQGYTLNAIAERYPINKQMVSLICNRRNWKHVV